MAPNERPRRSLAKAPVYTYNQVEDDDEDVDTKIDASPEERDLGLVARQDKDGESTSQSAHESDSEHEGYDSQDDSGVWDPCKPDTELLKPAAKKRKTSHVKAGPAKKAKEEKPFRFLDLPPELRNRIYELALIKGDHTIVKFKQSGGRDTVRRGPVYTVTYTARQWTWRTQRTSDKPVVPVELIGKLNPALLRLNKQIYHEAVTVLYAPAFYFQNATGLEDFLFTIGPSNRKLLKTIVIKEWDQKVQKPHKARSAINWLADATALQCLHLDCELGHTHDLAERMKQIYFACQKFIEGYGAAKGRKDAALDIIKLSAANFEKSWYSNYARKDKRAGDDAEDNEAEFTRMLAAQVNRF